MRDLKLNAINSTTSLLFVWLSPICIMPTLPSFSGSSRSSCLIMERDRYVSEKDVFSAYVCCLFDQVISAIHLLNDLQGVQGLSDDSRDTVMYNRPAYHYADWVCLFQHSPFPEKSVVTSTHCSGYSQGRGDLFFFLPSMY
jgi:hypothetical protein